MNQTSTCAYPDTGRSKGVEECSISHKMESEKDPCTSLVLTISSHSQTPSGSAREREREREQGHMHGMVTQANSARGTHYEHLTTTAKIQSTQLHVRGQNIY